MSRSKLYAAAVPPTVRPSKVEHFMMRNLPKRMLDHIIGKRLGLLQKG